MKSAWIGIFIAIFTGTADPQDAPARPRFDVASVKPVRDAPPLAQMSGYINRGKLTLNNARLRQIIGVAYNVQGLRVEGGLKWLDSELFQISAKAEDANATEEQVRIMLQTLLEDRYQLKLRWESRLVSSYTLLTAKGGSKIQKAGETETNNCAFNVDPPKSELICRKSPMLGLVNALSNLLKAPVADQTGLSGYYDFTLSWEGSDSLAAIPDAMDTLGLKLEKRKVPTGILIVDSAEIPSDN